MDIYMDNIKLFIIKFFYIDKVVFCPKFYTDYRVACSEAEILFDCNDDVIDFIIYEVKPYDV